MGDPTSMTMAMVPLAPSLKKHKPVRGKWAALVLRDRHRDTSPSATADRHVHFTEQLEEEFERPVATAEEKACCHYSMEELDAMLARAKQYGEPLEARVAAQPRDTIFEQGFLSFPVFLHHKRYYCLLRNHQQLMCYSSPTHAASNTHVKAQFTVAKVEDCQMMRMDAQIKQFGAHLPPKLPFMLRITKANGDHVIVTADSRSAKRNWMGTFTRMLPHVSCSERSERMKRAAQATRRRVSL